ncbi:LysR family transcriptional regulator [Microlunatus parietis]|uniref:DNA-binding transcriptional LysR family regulator n=1 Tax=Microlunatus parietis TaxID=682979 RepID=A0A7Y9I585_9ACTN|nr:LysR family transcriptional regulator [Microlunatus parietis]NYE70343.1 DNA-binding transcriptional LysR family regulator [Microlunatus parietis]
MIDVHRLRILRSVVATGSVHRAARLLGYSPSAVSQHLTALTRETGLALVERNGRGIQPTDAGRRLAAEAGEVLGAINRIDGVVDDLRSGRSGRLTMRYFASAGATWVPVVTATLLREFADLAVDLRHAELRDAGLVVSPDLDISVEAVHPASPAGYTAQRLLDDPYLVVVDAGHRLAAAEAVPIVELAEEPWVDNDLPFAPCRQIPIEACAAAGYSPRFAVETHDFATALAFVRQGLGITVLPRLACRDLPAGLVAVPLVEPTPVRQIQVLIKDAAAGTPPMRRAIELLRDCAAQERDRVPVTA